MPYIPSTEHLVDGSANIPKVDDIVKWSISRVEVNTRLAEVGYDHRLEGKIVNQNSEVYVCGRGD